MMLTGDADLTTAIRAVNEGNIFRFLTKPCDPEDLMKALTAGIDQYRLVCAEKELLEGTLNGCVRVLTEILSMADPAAFGRATEMKEIAGKIARRLGIKRTWEVEVAIMLAQIGRVTIPPELLAKADGGGELTEEEQSMLEKVPAAGGTLISHIPRLESVAQIVTHQRSPDGVKGKDEDVQEAARVLKALSDLVELEVESGSRASAMLRLRQEPMGNEPRILNALSEYVSAAAKDDDSEERRSVPIAFDDLRPGHVLTGPMLTLDGRCILAEGHRITAVLLARLRNHQRMTGFKEPILVEAGSLDRKEAG